MFASNLDERISKTVWIESCQQAQTMLDYVVDHPGGETVDGLRSVAINVIGQAGYSQTRPWSHDPGKLTAEAKSGRAAFFAMLSLTKDMLVSAAMLPPKLMKLPFMPAALQAMGRHLEMTPRYVQEMLEEESQAATDKSKRRNSFLSLMLQLSDEDKRSGQAEFSLTDGEISGSLFIFTIAGFDTTANAMGFAVTMLAAHPEWQDWVREELRGLDPDMSTWKYEEVFPRCRRTLALMVILGAHLSCLPVCLSWLT